MPDEARSPAASLALITLWRPRHLSPENNRRVGAERASAPNERREEEPRCEKERDRTTDADVPVMGPGARSERERTARGEPRNYVIAVSLR